MNDPACEFGVGTGHYALMLPIVSAGKEDFLIETTRNTVELLKRHGFKPVFIESEGAHWRDHLSQFAQQLFQAPNSQRFSTRQ